MPRSLDITAESSASVEQIKATFCREEYWLARLGDDGAVTLDSLEVDPSGTVAVRLTQRLGRGRLPDLVSRAIPGELKLSYYEEWRPDDRGRLLGKAVLSAVNGLGSTRAENSVSRTDNGSRLRSAVNVEVKIPLLGRALEQSIVDGLTDSIPSTLRFTTSWINEHA